MPLIYDADKIAIRALSDGDLIHFDRRLHKVYTHDLKLAATDHRIGRLLKTLIQAHIWAVEELRRRGLRHPEFGGPPLPVEREKIRTDFGEFVTTARIRTMPAIRISQADAEKIAAGDISFVILPDRDESRSLPEGPAPGAVVIAGRQAIGRVTFLGGIQSANEERQRFGVRTIDPRRPWRAIGIAFFPFVSPVSVRVPAGRGGVVRPGDFRLTSRALEKQGKAALGFVFDEDDQVLAVHRRVPPLVWSPPGGTVKRDEDPVKAARRKVLEETGIEMTSAFEARDLSGIGVPNLVAVVGRAQQAKPKTTRKFRSGQWIPISKLSELTPLSPGRGSFRRLLEDLRAFEKAEIAKDLVSMPLADVTAGFLRGLEGSGVLHIDERLHEDFAPLVATDSKRGQIVTAHQAAVDELARRKIPHLPEDSLTEITGGPEAPPAAPAAKEECRLDFTDEQLKAFPKDDKTEWQKATGIQTVLFRKDDWTIPGARKWLKDHDFTDEKIDDPEGGNTLRFRQFPPGQCVDESFSALTRDLPKGITLVSCEKKSVPARKQDEFDGAHDHPHEPNGIHDHEGLPPATGGHSHPGATPRMFKPGLSEEDVRLLTLGAHRHRPEDPLEGVHVGSTGEGKHLHPVAQGMGVEVDPDTLADLHLTRPWLDGFVRAMIRERGAPDEPWGDWRIWTKLDGFIHSIHPQHQPKASPRAHEWLFTSIDTKLIDKRYEFEDGTVRPPTTADFEAEAKWLAEFAAKPEAEKAFHIRGTHWVPVPSSGSCPASHPRKLKSPSGSDRCYTASAAAALRSTPDYKSIEAELVAEPAKGPQAKFRVFAPIVHYEEQVITKRGVTEKRRLIYGVVYSPFKVDAQNDWTDEHEIETAAHRWMLESQKIKLMHRFNTDKVRPVESYIAPQDLTLGRRHVKKGAWVLVSKVFDDVTWGKVERKEITGYSLGGRSGTREEAPRGS